ncbi:type IV pilus twitching motility protein PilT [Candidatus Nomurabacteria bacterium]|nr:type IV pilus twitching motility protein PilT [Candidatus Nomurabacteria bacterium]MCB9827212.1 type IV pilus twitching motility protein PilT [Candidatus Nomurabacteria bacterium]MCB9827504.1 type IV pilus twitching motility protein PilT [Candidatus Nomurabacteria bacterium]HXK52563.1 type IV pilus twitching motility protein PilT [bacterium]
MAINASQLLEKVIEVNASDLHLVVGMPPSIRVNTVLSRLDDYGILSIEDIQYFISKILSQDQQNLFDLNKELDLSVALSNKARFRVNVFYQKGYPSVALRLIPMLVPSLDSLNLPPIIKNIGELKQGLVLVVGPTGNGKSTTIASMIDYINETRSEHIVTVEDPIEYIFTSKKSLIEQREMYLDTHSWEAALKSVLRQDPNVVFIGEMRDKETMESVLNIAETGHLVFATLHTNSAAQSLDRVISSFPETQQLQVRLQLSQVIEAVISQRLLPSPNKGTVPAVELLLATDAVRSLIREGKAYQIDNVISTGATYGMMTLDASLALLVSQNYVDLEEAMKRSLNPENLRRMLKMGGSK